MNRFSDRLYELLPAVYRLRDADHGNALKSLLDVIVEQAGLVEDDIGQLYDNWFIETCAEWLVPYIGDLLGVRGLHQTDTGFTQRAYVANTLAYRRRKGTATMLEQLAHDTTLWQARVVEFFQLLETTQYINHLRLANLRTPDLCRENTRELLDGPFDTIAHTADVRRISSGRGRHNIHNVGIYLWRLRSFTLEDVEPRSWGGLSDGRFTFSPVGNSIPLFNRPRTETEIAHLAEEADVPDAIRPAAFYLDLQDYLEHNLSLAETGRDKKSIYYGADASLSIRHNGSFIPPADVVSIDLSGWARPPARVRGSLTNKLPAAIALSAPLAAGTPAVQVTIGSKGPYPAVLTDLPTTPQQAATLLTAAIQQENNNSAFLRAQVVAVDDRLFVLPGEPGLAIAFATTAQDVTTLGELKLDALLPVDAALSSLLKPFPKLAAGKMNLTIAGIGPREIALSPLPTNLAAARQRLEVAIRAADLSSAFQDARVLVLDDRLLIMPGLGAGDTSGGPVTFTETVADPEPDPATVYLLGLKDRVGIDVRLGRIAFPLGVAVGKVRADLTYGFSGDLGGGAYDRRWIRQAGDALPTAYQNSVAEPKQLGQYLRVAASMVDPPADFATISDALDQWANVLHKPHMVIEICDNGTYAEDLAIPIGAKDLIIQAENKKRPVLVGDVTVTGTQRGRLALNGLLIAGGVSVAGTSSLHQLDILHTTLIPGGELDAGGQAFDPDRASLDVKDTIPELTVNLYRTISGPLHLPVGITSLGVRDSILESPVRNQPARISSVLVSGDVTPVKISNNPPAQMTIAIGEEGPYPITLIRPSGVPARQVLPVSTLAVCLEMAIRLAHKSPAFQKAQVFREKDTLIVVPGRPAAVSFAAAGGHHLIDYLGLAAGQAVRREALLSGAIRFPLSASNPALDLTLGDESATISMSSPATERQVRGALEQAIRAASAQPAFKKAMVAYQAGAGQLVVIPGVGEVAPRIRAATADATTANELSLVSDHFVIASVLTGEQPAPPTSLVCTTVFGQVHVKELTLASETIFNSYVSADRRQAGCVRFSFVPEGSRTPRRYRCQPELEIKTRLDEVKYATPAKKDRIRQAVLSRLTPSYTSTQYGHPAYAQLGQSCPNEIRTGAEDGGEMGAFCFLKQPQREENLLSSLDEYLRFGLEAGIFYET